MKEQGEKQNNYLQMRDQMRPYFLTFDQEEIIGKWDLNHDEAYLYIRFAGRNYRVGRKTGIVEWSEDGFQTCVEGDYNESLTIYDILCYAKPGCSLAGEYAPSSSLKGIVYTGMNAGSAMGPNKTAEYFDEHLDLLESACVALGGVPEGKGDLAYRLPLFDFLPVRFSFWQRDEDFPPEIKLLWDTNVLDYLHFETLFLAAGHLLCRLKEEMERA